MRLLGIAVRRLVGHHHHGVPLSVMTTRVIGRDISNTSTYRAVHHSPLLPSSLPLSHPSMMYRSSSIIGRRGLSAPSSPQSSAVVPSSSPSPSSYSSSSISAPLPSSQSHTAHHTLFVHNAKHKGLYKGKFPLYLHKSRGWWLSARMRALWSCIGSVTAVGLAYYVITHIEEVPITGRKRFVPLSPYWERKLGEILYAEELSTHAAHVLPHDHEAVQWVRKVGLRIARVSGLPDTTEWTFNVIDLPLVNAFCFPGGKVMVFAGMLAKVAKSATPEDDLAVILGHEIAHAVARHSTEKITYLLPILMVAMLADSSPLISWAYNFLFQLPYERAQETEADQIGLMLMSRACFHPEVAAPFWMNMQSTSEDMNYFSTHPSDDRRARRCTEWLPQAQAERQSASCPLPPPERPQSQPQQSIFTRLFKPRPPPAKQPSASPPSSSSSPVASSSSGSKQ